MIKLCGHKFKWHLPGQLYLKRVYGLGTGVNALYCTKPINISCTKMPIKKTDTVVFLCSEVECGRSPLLDKPRGGKRPRIVNGQAASSGQFPWLAALLYRQEPGSKDGEGHFACTGSLVTNRSCIINYTVTTK